MLLIDIAFRIPLPEESFFSLALPDGNCLQVDGNVRNKYLIGYGIACKPIIGTRTAERNVNVGSRQIIFIADGGSNSISGIFLVISVIRFQTIVAFVIVVTCGAACAAATATVAIVVTMFGNTDEIFVYD